MAERAAAPLSAHRLLGDQEGAALLRPDGTVDWWCSPHFDSPPRCWSLLDPGGGACAFADATPDRLSAAGSGPPAGPTAMTRLRFPDGRAVVRDGLVAGRLVRLVEAVDGPLEVVHTAALGGMGSPAGPGRAVTTALRAAPDKPAALAVEGGGADTCDPNVAAAEIASASARFRHELSGHRSPGGHPNRVEDALAVLWACTSATTGGVVAAPTTSLPEAPGHDRQFDYRYTWLRDGALSASVAALLGRPDLAAGPLTFLERLGHQVFEAPMFTVGGDEVPDEEEVPHVAGWAGSRPVRVGNGAKGQRQFDALGFVVDAVAVCAKSKGSLDDGLWSLVVAIAERACEEDHPQPSSGIWELRRPRHLVSADIGRWISLDRAIGLERAWKPARARHRWRQARRRCRERVLGELRPDGRLPQSYGGALDPPDASALLIPMLGLLGRHDERAHRLVDAHLAQLSAGPFVYRYPPGTDDGFSGREGAFLPCSWWAVSALARLGRAREARARADQLCGRLPALLSEEIDPDTGAALGNIPLVWSHMEAARALYLLEQAEQRLRRTPRREVVAHG